MVVVRRLSIVVAVASLFGLWIALPSLAATGKALDHPAWSGPETEAPASSPAARQSWWPPGRRYEWTGRSTGQRFVAIDPWTSPAEGHVWTGATAATTALTTWSLWTGRLPLPRRWRDRPRRHHPSSS